MSSLIDLEEALAHLTRQVEEMSDVIARQDREIDRLTARVQMLMNREAEREADSSGTIPRADQNAPHW